MQMWKFILAYDGGPFAGWQIQPAQPTVQGTLASALYRLTGEHVLPQGSGRTDAGVHALAQVASCALAAPIPPENLLRALNRALPPAVRVLSAEHAAADFHARHTAVRKTYEYRIFPRREARAEPVCPPMLAPYVWDCPRLIDLEQARQAAAAILGEHDFTSFAAADPDLSTRSATDGSANKSACRTVFQSCWQEQDGLLIYRVTGSGFLHHMVRNLVGTFVEAACGRRQPGSIGATLAARNRSAAGPTAPARGLFLHSVEYAR